MGDDEQLEATSGIEGESIDQPPRPRRSTRMPQGFAVRPTQPRHRLQRGLR